MLPFCPGRRAAASCLDLSGGNLSHALLCRIATLATIDDAKKFAELLGIDVAITILVEKRDELPRCDN